MSDLTSLPNIGKTLAFLLSEVDITTEEELRQVGTEQAYIRIQAIDPGACMSKLCAIEGAIQGIRWHHLSAERKTELKQFFQLVHKTTKI